VWEDLCIHRAPVVARAFIQAIALCAPITAGITTATAQVLLMPASRMRRREEGQAIPHHVPKEALWLIWACMASLQ